MSRRFVGWVGLALALIVGCKPKTTTSTGPTLKSLELWIAQPSIPKGQPDAVLATAVYSDGSRQDVSVQSTWGTSEAFIATVSCTTTACTVTTANVGTAILTVSYQSLISTLTVNVVSATPVDLTATVAQPSIPKGTQTYVTAISDFSDTSTFDVSDNATWTSSDETVATVACPDGLCAATAVGPGTATLTAQFAGLTATVDLTVTDAIVDALGLSDSLVTLNVGDMHTTTATATLTDQTMIDVTSQADWSTSDATVATVSGGVITAVAGGEATITATIGVESATLQVVVEANQTGVTIQTASPTVALGASYQMQASATFEGNVEASVTSAATWSSSDPSIAAVSSTGLVTTGGSGRTTGMATITVEYGGFSDSTTLTVGAPVPASVSIAAVSGLHAGDAPYAISASIVDTNGGVASPSGAVTYMVSNENVATVDDSGHLTAKMAGSVTITATADGVSGTLTVQIGGALSSVVVSPMQTTLLLSDGTAKLLKAAGFYAGAVSTEPLSEGVTWSSSDASVFVNVTQASPAQALVGCNTAGTSTITATVTLASGSTLSGTATVTCQ